METRWDGQRGRDVYQPTSLAIRCKRAPLPTPMQSYIWPAMGSRADFVVVDESRAGSPDDFMQPLVFELYRRQGTLPAVRVIAPDFESIVAFQRSYQKLARDGPTGGNNIF